MSAFAAKCRGGRGVVALVVLVLGLGIAAGQIYPPLAPPIPPPPLAPQHPQQPAAPIALPSRPPIIVSSSDSGILILPTQFSAPPALPPGAPAYLPAVPSLPTVPTVPAPPNPAYAAAPTPVAPLAPAAPAVIVPPAATAPVIPPITPPIAPPATLGQLPAVQVLPAPQVLHAPRVLPEPQVLPEPEVPAMPLVPQPPPAAQPVPVPPGLSTGIVLPGRAGMTEPTTPAAPGTAAPAPGGAYHNPYPPRRGHKGLVDSLHRDDCYGFKSLFDSLHPANEKGKHWYEKLSLRGYTQFRYGRTVAQSQFGADPSLLGDRSINGNTENFSIRRMRLILFGDVSDHLGIYIQPDFGNVPSSGSTATFFGQLRDAYADVYVDTTKIHRFRVGLSKIPFGWENMQSSQNRVPLDRTDAINTGASPNERDLGVFYYWTPVEKQKLLRELVDGGLKGSGNYGIFGLGVYNGQGGSQLEQNLNLHVVARLTYPFQLPNGQVVEAGIQGYTGESVVQGTDIRPLGVGDEGVTPDGTGDRRGFRDQRLAATFVWYPQPFGFQAEWNVGEGPGLNDAQTAVGVRPLNGGYAMVMYKLDTRRCGIFTPYCRYQHYRGGYRAVANAPYGTHDEWNLGVEWQIRKEMELVLEYAVVNGINLNAIDRAGVTSYRKFDGGVLRAQFQVNY